MATKLGMLLNDYESAIKMWLADSWSPVLSNLYKTLLIDVRALTVVMEERFLPVWQKWVFSQIAYTPNGDWKKCYPSVNTVFLQKGETYIVSFSNEGNDPYVSFEIENDAAKGTTRFHFFEMNGTVQQALYLINLFCDFAEMEEEHI